MYTNAKTALQKSSHIIAGVRHDVNTPRKRRWRDADMWSVVRRRTALVRESSKTIADVTSNSHTRRVRIYCVCVVIVVMAGWRMDRISRPSIPNAPLSWCTQPFWWNRDLLRLSIRKTRTRNSLLSMSVFYCMSASLCLCASLYLCLSLLVWLHLHYFFAWYTLRLRKTETWRYLCEFVTIFATFFTILIHFYCTISVSLWRIVFTAYSSYRFTVDIKNFCILFVTITFWL